ncbi:MAG: hypothetical protein ACYTJ0_11615 [Planctomycetota bacterium]|jgi:hypothetical protein
MKRTRIMTIGLTAIDHAVRKGWTLELRPGEAVLRGPQGDQLDRIPLPEMPHRVQLPSRAGSRRVSIIVGNRVLRFRARPGGVRRIRRLAERGLAPSGPQALREIRTRAVRNVVVGIMTTALALGLVAASWLDVAVPAPESARLPLMIGVALLLSLGLVAAGCGLHGISNYAELKQLGRRLAGPGLHH